MEQENKEELKKLKRGPKIHGPDSILALLKSEILGASKAQLCDRSSCFESTGFEFDCEPTIDQEPSHVHIK